MLFLPMSYLATSCVQHQVRRFLDEGLVEIYEQAELAVKPLDLKFDQEEALNSAQECHTLNTASHFCDKNVNSALKNTQ